VVGRLNDGVLLAVRADALAESLTAHAEGIAARAAALIAVSHSARGPVVSGGDDAAVDGDDSPDLALHTVAPAGSHPGDAHEVLVPVRAFEKKAARQDGLDIALEGLAATLVVHGEVGQGLHCGELLAGGIAIARLFAALELVQALEGLGISGPGAALDAGESRGGIGIDPDELELGAPGAQGCDFGGVADRIDDVVAVRRHPGEQTLGQDTLAVFGTQTRAGLDHALAGLALAAFRQHIADHVRQRQRVEAPLLEIGHHLALAGGVGARETEDHGKSPPAFSYRETGVAVKTEPVRHR